MRFSGECAPERGFQLVAVSAIAFCFVYFKSAVTVGLNIFKSTDFAFSINISSELKLHSLDKIMSKDTSDESNYEVYIKYLINLFQTKYDLHQYKPKLQKNT